MKLPEGIYPIGAASDSTFCSEVFGWSIGMEFETPTRTKNTNDVDVKNFALVFDIEGSAYII